MAGTVGQTLPAYVTVLGVGVTELTVTVVRVSGNVMCCLLILMRMVMVMSTAAVLVGVLFMLVLFMRVVMAAAAVLMGMLSMVVSLVGMFVFTAAGIIVPVEERL